MANFKIGSKTVGDGAPVYFIADISANHDGDLSRAKDLCSRAQAAGADCAKFQHFRADQIVSRYGFQQVGKLSHQAGWKEDVYSAFQRLSVPEFWAEELKAHCDRIGIEFMSTPYDLEAVDHLEPYVNAYKIGSGDITYHELISKVASKGKPVLIATGASDMQEVEMAMCLLDYTEACIMQCNTNYTAQDEKNLPHLNLRVLQTYADWYPDAVLGLSDHTSRLGPVLAAVALGAKVVERHFTDERERVGPDHPFSMDSWMWKKMVGEVRAMEQALGEPTKFVAENERETVILQRRCLRAARDLQAGHKLEADDIVALRPAPPDSYPPYLLERIVSRVLKEDIREGDYFREESVG